MIETPVKNVKDTLQFTQDEDFENFDKATKILGDNHTKKEYEDRYKDLQKPKIASWTEPENSKLKEYVEMYGDHKWSTIASLLPGRNSKQCRDHYINQLAPNIVKGGWTADEDKKILEGAKIYGTSWTKIRSQLPNRSELDIKNRYNKLIRELIDRGRILDVDETIKEVLNNPKVNENTKEATGGEKTLELKLEVTQKIKDMQKEIKSRIPEHSSSFSSQRSLKSSSSALTAGGSGSRVRGGSSSGSSGLFKTKPEDFIHKVDVSPYEDILVPGRISEVAQVLSEEAKRHQKLQKCTLNPYDIFKIKNLNRAIYQRVPIRRYGFLPDNIYDAMFMRSLNINIPIPDNASIANTTHSLHLSLHPPQPQQEPPPPPTPHTPIPPSSSPSSATSSSSIPIPSTATPPPQESQQPPPPATTANTTNGTTTPITTTNSESESGVDPLLNLFHSSTAKSSVLTSSALLSPPNQYLSKRRRQIESNPFIVDWYCPSCGNKNEAGSTECRFNKCDFYNPYISKYEQQLHIQRLEQAVIVLEAEREESQRQINRLEIEASRLNMQEKQSQQQQQRKDIGRRSRSSSRSRRTSQQQQQQQQPRRVYYTRQRTSGMEEDDEDYEINDYNKHIKQENQQQQQQQQQQQPEFNRNIVEEEPPPPQQEIYIDENENMIPYPINLLEQNRNKEDGSLKPWYCPSCNNKNDFLEDECRVCHGDNPNRLANINGRIVKKFTFTSIDTPIYFPENAFLNENQPPPPPPPPPPSLSISHNFDNENVWYCEVCGEMNNNGFDLCRKCNEQRPNIQSLHSVKSTWSCFHCHFKNKDENNICEKCKMERSSALQLINGDDEEDYDDDIIGDMYTDSYDKETDD